jgi:hypothetical protein
MPLEIAEKLKRGVFDGVAEVAELKKSRCYDLLLHSYDRLQTGRLYESAYHGPGHIGRVMLLGAIIAMNNAGMDPKSVPIVGIDATDDGIEALKAGEMDMTVYQSHEGQASGGVQAAINMLEGKDIAEGTDCEVSSECPYVLYYPFIPVTADTLDQIKK